MAYTETGDAISVDCNIASCDNARYVIIEARSDFNFHSCGVQVLGETFVQPCPPTAADCATATVSNWNAAISDLIVASNTVETSEAWPAFETSFTALCGNPSDCSSDIVYALQVYDCLSCDDALTCNTGCDSYTDINNGTINADNTFTSELAYWVNHGARIKACIGSNCGYSQPFRYTHDFYINCYE